MDIVDAQVHVGRGSIAATLAAMDALGVSGVMIDEFWGTREGDDPTHIAPGFRLPNGAWRATCPTAEEACAVHPDRFAYLVRVDRRDPDLACLMRVIGSTPHARAVRVQPVWTMDEARAFADGAYDEVFQLADRHGLAVCLFMPGFAELLAPYLAKFPQVTFVVDHCGMAFPRIPPDRPEDERRRVEQLSYFDEVLRLAAHPNAALKWSHVQNRFGAKDFPYEPVRPILRRAVDAFGAERLLWASDHTVIPNHSWSDMLHAVRDDPGLSAEEKAWILGGSARRIFDWPAQH
jgi:predicted TIM-barrel fold metal-dependent hydrolase